MAKQVKALCFHCDGRMNVGESFCGHCGRPSIWATHDERVAWEVAQWRSANGAKRQDVHTPTFSPQRAAHRENGRREEPAQMAATASAYEEIVSVRDYAPTVRGHVQEPAPAAVAVPEAKAEPVRETPPPQSPVPPAPVVNTSPPLPPVPTTREAPAAAVETPQPAAVAEAPPVQRETAPALHVVAPFEPPTTDELLEELVLLVGKMNERMESIEHALSRPSMRQRMVAAWRHLVAFLRRLYRAG